MKSLREDSYTLLFQQYHQSYRLDSPSTSILDIAYNICLATAGRDGQPHATLVWFVESDGHILALSHHNALKVRNIRSNPKVHLTTGPFKAFGTAEIRDDPDTMTNCIDLLKKRYKSMQQEYERVLLFLPIMDCVIDITPTKVGLS